MNQLLPVCQSVAGRFDLKPEELRQDQRQGVRPPRWLAPSRAWCPQARVPVGAPEPTASETGGQGRERVRPATLTFLDREMLVGLVPEGRVRGTQCSGVSSVGCPRRPPSSTVFLRSTEPSPPAPAARPAQASPSVVRATLTSRGPSHPLKWVRSIPLFLNRWRG